MAEAATPPLILSVFATFAVGGPQARFATIARGLGAAARNAVIAMDGRTEARALLDPALDIAFPVFSRGGNTLARLARMRALLRQVRPSLLVTSNWGSIEWAVANAPWGRPLVPHVHMEDGFGPDERDHQLPRRVLARRAVLRAATVVVPSQGLQRLAVGAWRLDHRRVHLIPNGVDLARFRPHAPRNDAVPTIGTVAALRPEKNLGRLLRAAAIALREAPFTLEIVGEGPERPALEALAASLGIADRVRLPGHAAAPDTALARFDAFALSSDTEQMPIALLEAMACGLPVAATDVGDVRTMLGEAGAAFVTPRDDAALGAALAGLASSAERRASLGAAMRARAEAEFGVERMIARWREVFAEVAGVSI